MQPDTFTLLNALTAHRTASPQEGVLLGLGWAGLRALGVSGGTL